VWDAATGDVIAIRFTGRTDSIQYVAFSPCEEYLVSGSYGGHIRVEKIVTEDIHALDQFLMNGDGWVCGKEGELLFWIPVLHRPCHLEPSTVWISGKQATRLDLSNFVHGSNWATVHDHRL
jgi:WD40 repeat protein